LAGNGHKQQISPSTVQAEMEEGLGGPSFVLKHNGKLPPAAVQESQYIIVFHLSVLLLLILIRSKNQAQDDVS